MLKVVYVIVLLFLFPFNSDFTIAHEKNNSEKNDGILSLNESEKVKIVKLIKSFIKNIQKRNYEILQKLTTGREKELYLKLKDNFLSKKDNFLSKNDAFNQIFKKYFSELNDFICDFIYVDLKLKKAIATCNFEFKISSSGFVNSKKIRKINYYLVIEDNEWKITYSKLKSEIIYSENKNQMVLK